VQCAASVLQFLRDAHSQSRLKIAARRYYSAAVRVQRVFATTLRLVRSQRAALSRRWDEVDRERVLALARRRQCEAMENAVAYALARDAARREKEARVATRRGPVGVPRTGSAKSKRYVGVVARLLLAHSRAVPVGTVPWWLEQPRSLPVVTSCLHVPRPLSLFSSAAARGRAVQTLARESEGKPRRCHRGTCAQARGLHPARRRRARVR
jgi:hypothetical protein